MKKELTINDLLDTKTRVLLYISSLFTLLFLQTFCTNICEFIDGLMPNQIFRNLFIIFIIHSIFREFLYWRFKVKSTTLSLPRQAYLLSIISWIFAGFCAFSLHYVLYPEFPVLSHIRIFLSYIILGAAILAQLEYILFEIRYKKISKNTNYTFFNEKISRRVIETFLIFTVSPIITLLLIILRYNTEGTIGSHVTIDVMYIGGLMIFIAIILAVIFGNILKNDTRVIIENINIVKAGEYNNTQTINRPDELGEISFAIKDMSKSIKEGIAEIESLHDEITNTQKEIIYTMGEIAETRSKETGNHVKRVAEYSYLLAINCGLSKEEASILKLASPMHDIGKVGIPDNILNKPGKLTHEEFDVMKTHAQLGFEMLRHSKKPILQAAAIVSREHHEKYNGTGYPRGLKENEIHIFARITSVADVFDALGSDRVYKKAWEDEKIFNLFKEEKGKHFDPIIIDLFFENIEEIYKIRNMFKDI
jgi:HD-GYP domain-containing protein (c-di-GMP phosphodiesterase class II)